MYGPVGPVRQHEDTVRFSEKELQRDLTVVISNLESNEIESPVSASYLQIVFGGLLEGRRSFRVGFHAVGYGVSNNF